MWRVVVINCLLLGIAFLVAELIFGTWFSDQHALMKFTKLRNYEKVQENPIHVGKPTVTYSRDNYGFRGLEGDVSDIDILTVGGSTTDQRWVDNSQTYQAVMRDLFAASGQSVSIVNAGIDGQSTFGHIANFSSWFNEIPNLDARYVLYYVGINDLLISQPTDTYDVVALEDNAYNNLKATIKTKSVFYQLYRVVKSAFAEEHSLNELNRTNIADREPLVTEPKISAPLDVVFGPSLESYTDRISELAKLTRDFGAEPIFVTQRSARWTRRNGQVAGIAEYQPDFFELVRQQLPKEYQNLNGVDFYRFERALADAQMAACENVDAICLDLMAEIDFDLASDFYDPIHTSATGSQAIGEYLYSRLGNLELGD
ncbi:SGNH/GDSL hydrolase family protein [Ruegeria arenilitoris]|uniref:SGNH/GDSL hydrolase family protein n=1 Tax=Ruegeria arenilitoris TaxID=1173585 RepID=UPI00147D48A4|nr:SGNH/GDSL hydrolase family protein [Ruegeria arenilitoris]